MLNIVKNYREGETKQLGGIDINPEAVAFLEKTFKGGYFRVGNVENIFISDSASDIILTDMTLIYIGPMKIKQALKEVRRIARN